MQQTVNLSTYVFEGSNPSLPTISSFKRKIIQPERGIIFRNNYKRNGGSGEALPEPEQASLDHGNSTASVQQAFC